jgi:hypothetical protein
MEYCACERGKLLPLAHLILCVLLTIYLHSVSPPVLFYDPRLLGGVKAKSSWVVHQEHDKAGDGVDPAFEMVSSPNVPGAVIEDMGLGFWCMLRSVQVLWRLVRKEPQMELSYRSVFGGGTDQAAALGGYVLGFCAFSWACFRVLSNVLHVSTVWFSLPQKLQVLDLLLIFFFFFKSSGMYFNTGLKGGLNRSPYFTYTCRLPGFSCEPQLQTRIQHVARAKTKAEQE